MSRFSNKRRLGTPAPGGQQTQQPVADQEKENPKAPDRLELKAEGTGNYCIKLKWEPVDSNPELYGYRLERSPARRDIWTSVHEPLPVLPVKTTEFGVPVEPYKVYDFCVRSAIKIERKAIYSDGCYLDDVVAKKQYQPFPPRNIMVTDRTTKSVSLKWLEPLPAADVSPDSYEYVIEMCDYTDGALDNWQVCCRTTELVCTVEVQHCETCCPRIRVSTHNKVNDVSSLPLTMGHPEVRITIEEKNGESIKTITSRWQVSHTTVNNIEPGSVIFVVSCEDMTGLRELWMNYKLGKLKKFFQDLFALEASLASEVSDTDLDLNIRIHPKEFHSCRRHLMLTCATDRGFTVVNMEGTHLRANTQLGLSEDYPVYCKPLSPRTTCSQLDYLDPAIPTDQIHVTVVQNLAQRQIELQEDMVRSLQREVTRLTQEQETAQKLLLDNKKEIQDLAGANKGMEDIIDELLADKTKLANKLAMKEHEEKVTGDKMESLQRDIDRLIREKAMAQMEIEDLKETNNELLAQNATIQSKLTRMEMPRRPQGTSKDIPSTKSPSTAKAGRVWEPREEGESPELTPRLYRVASAAKTRKTVQSLLQGDRLTTSERPVPKCKANDYATKLAECTQRASTILLHDDWFNYDIQQHLAVYLDRRPPLSSMPSWRNFFDQFGLTKHELDAAESFPSPTMTLFAVLQTRKAKDRHTVKKVLEALHNLKFYDAANVLYDELLKHKS